MEFDYYFLLCIGLAHNHKFVGTPFIPYNMMHVEREEMKICTAE